jgi:hypothetical protein
MASRRERKRRERGSNKRLEKIIVELHGLYYSLPGIIRVVKSRERNWVR